MRTLPLGAANPGYVDRLLGVTIASIHTETDGNDWRTKPHGN